VHLGSKFNASIASNLPENWKRQADLRAKAWKELRKKYMRPLTPES